MFIGYAVVLFCSVGEQPDASLSAEGSGAAPQAQQQQQRVPIHKPFTQSRVPPDLPMHPAPRHITEEELRVLEGCLHRWRSEVENDTRGTHKHITTVVIIMYIPISFGFACSLFAILCIRSAG